MKLINAAFAIAALICGTTAWAVTPVRVPLESFQVVGEEFTDCGDFKVLDDWGYEGEEITYFNEDGSINRIMYKLRFPGGIYYNSNQPSYWLSGNAEHATRWLYFKDGEPTTATAVNHSIFVTAPGYGVVFKTASRLEIDWVTGEITFQAGTDDYQAGNFDALCAALRP